MSSLDPELIEQLRKLIAASRRRQELYIDTIADAVLLAAQQVQDKRIELLEQGPEVSGTEVFFDILLSVVLSGPVAGELLSIAGRALLNPILRTRAAFAVLPKTALGNEIRYRISISQVRSARQINVTRDFLRQANGRRLYRGIVYEVAEGAGPVVAAVGRGVRRAGSPNTPNLVSGDTAGVGVVDLVQGFARQQKAAINLFHDYLDIEVQNSIVDQDTVKELRSLLHDGLARPVKNYNLADIKERYKLFFEVCIWVMLFETGFSVAGKSDRLIDYWLRRFRTLETDYSESFLEYAARNVRREAYPYPRARQRPVSESIREYAVKHLYRYLKLLRELIIEEGKQQKGLVLIRAARPEVRREEATQ